jgi:AbrB family looped-hinge helix DNA binding protein
MAYVGKITRRGQATIPIELREKYAIEEGDEILFEDRGEEIVIRVIPRLEQMAGKYARFATVEDVKKQLDKMREEYLD